MKYISEESIFESWKRLVVAGEAVKAPLNKFFGFIELIKSLNIPSDEAIRYNYQYHLVSSTLSNSLQDLYFFGSNVKSFTSTDIVYVIFPHGWEESVLQVFLKNSPLSIYDTATICLQSAVFDDSFTPQQVVDRFIKEYHLTNVKETFFSTEEPQIKFAEVPPNRDKLFAFMKGFIATTDASKFTIGLERSVIAANPGELTRGPLTQPLYSGQENLKCLLIANFDLGARYNITSVVNLKSISSSLHIPRNKLIYGAPGTGKSFELRKQAREAGFSEENCLRVTFYPNLSYQQFVGTYKPTPVYRSVETTTELFDSDRITKLSEPLNKEPLIDYSFVPGPFLTLLIKALKEPEVNYMLIIEEINRASVSSVFGDTFQLLDRNTEGESEYDIVFNRDIMGFMASQGLPLSKVKIPSNLFIWATMNSADQGVMPLDAAFKRRWAFEYLPLNSKEEAVADQSIIFQNKKYSWNSFRNGLNLKLKQLGVPEDKLIGPFFFNQIESLDSNAIKNKLLLYLRDDVVRHNPQSLFIQRTFSDIVNAYDAGGEIFNDTTFFAQATDSES